MSSVAESLVAARAARADWPFLIASVLALAVLVALVLVDGQPAAAALLAFGFALGAVFLKTEFSFTASWRRLIVRGQADGFLGGLLLIAIAAAAIVPVAALIPGFGGAIAPIGPSLIVGAFVFGIGMQLANGCGSGTLYTVGGGSGRMLLTLAFFIAGSVIGSLHLPAFLALGGIDPILAAHYFGPWGGLAVTLAESSFSSLGRDAIGAEIDLKGPLGPTALLFSESPSRIVVTFAAADANAIQEIADRNNAPFAILGRVGGTKLTINVNGNEAIDDAVSELEAAWRTALSGISVCRSSAGWSLGQT